MGDHRATKCERFSDYKGLCIGIPCGKEFCMNVAKESLLFFPVHRASIFDGWAKFSLRSLNKCSFDFRLHRSGENKLDVAAALPQCAQNGDGRVQAFLHLQIADVSHSERYLR